MRLAEDRYEGLERLDNGGTWLAVYLILGGGVALLGFLGWLMTL